MGKRSIADARRAKQKTNEKVLVNEISRPKEKNKETNEKIYTNKTSEAKKDDENEELNATKEKLKQNYQSQDKLAPLFDDPEQSIDTCYIRLALLTQQQFQQQKDKMTNNQEKGKSEEDEKYEKEDEKYKEENGKWMNSLDYSLIYGNQTEIIELQDIWDDQQKESKICHISIRGEAGSGKSVLSQRIAYLWGNGQMWNHQFQYLLHIPLRKIIN
ncbi:non-muscle caldesmon, partial [Reticulomyxa filosa]